LEKLAGMKLELAAPRSLSARWAVARAARREGSELTVLAAALGLCWSRLQRHVPYTHDVLSYGDKVIDWLMSPDRGEHQVKLPGQIEEAGMQAFKLCWDGLVPVEGVEGFSPPPTVQAGGPSRGASEDDSSSSSEPGASIPAGSAN
jgi:hypothetical protein